MLAIILALTIHCTMTGEDKSGVLLTCDDNRRSELRIPISQWPSIWHGPELGFAYQVDSEGRPLASLLTTANQHAFITRMAAIRANTLREQRRWRRRALQQVSH